MSALHQVFKFSHDGRLLLTLGQPRVGGWDATHFNQPTDIAIRTRRRLLRVGRLRQQPRRAVRWQRTVPAGVGQKGRGRRSSATRTASRSAPMATCWSPIGRTHAFRCSTARACSSGNGSARKTPAGCFAVAVEPAGALYVGVRRADYDPPSNGVLKLDREWRTVASVGFRRRGRPGLQRRARPGRRSRRVDLHRRNPHQARRQASTALGGRRASRRRSSHVPGRTTMCMAFRL